MDIITYLNEELDKFKETHTMTQDELDAIEIWVNNGNSVYNNPYMVYGENGLPLDFLTAYRDNEEIYATLNAMSDKERELYLAELQGEITFEKLKEKYNVLHYEHGVYYQVLCKHGLLKEAEKLIELGKQSLDKYIDDTEELPFKD